VSDTQVPHHEDAHSGGHGNTPAAWTAVVVSLVGFTVGGIGLMFDPANFTIFWVGVVITVLAGVLFVAMAKMGYHT
jgi:hypothetical protein